MNQNQNHRLWQGHMNQISHQLPINLQNLSRCVSWMETEIDKLSAQCCTSENNLAELQDHLEASERRWEQLKGEHTALEEANQKLAEEVAALVQDPQSASDKRRVAAIFAENAYLMALTRLRAELDKDNNDDSVQRLNSLGAAVLELRKEKHELQGQIEKYMTKENENQATIEEQQRILEEQKIKLLEYQNRSISPEASQKPPRKRKRTTAKRTTEKRPKPLNSPTPSLETLS